MKSDTYKYAHTFKSDVVLILYIDATLILRKCEKITSKDLLEDQFDLKILTL